jgi:hypothetical protein
LFSFTEITADLAAAEKARAIARARHAQRTAPEWSLAADPCVVETTVTQTVTGRSGANVISSSNNSSGGGSSPHSLWTPSFWTRQRRYTKGKYFHRVVAFILGLYVISFLGTVYMVNDPIALCRANTSLWRFRAIMSICYVAIQLPLSLWFFIVLWHMRRHSKDAWVSSVHPIT